jgi:spore coat polysaccharide biosynthesis protein SpsF (cytidylyltransferase family)
MRNSPSLNVTAIIQVRMGSSRLSNKSLVDILGRPLLWHVLQRVRASQQVDRIIIATTTEPADDAIAAFAKEIQVLCYRGSVDDVLDRFLQAAHLVPTDAIVRVTADDPFKDPCLIDQTVATFREARDLDYISNTLIPTFPEGLDIEVFSMTALTTAWNEATLKSEREHVTPYIWKNPDRFRLKNFTSSENNSSLRWTIDYPEDLTFAREVYARLYNGSIFGTQDILELLRREPALSNINNNVLRNAGYLASLKAEAQRD